MRNDYSVVEATTSQRLIATPFNQQANCASPFQETSDELSWDEEEEERNNKDWFDDTPIYYHE